MRPRRILQIAKSLDMIAVHADGDGAFNILLAVIEERDLSGWEVQRLDDVQVCGSIWLSQSHLIRIEARIEPALKLHFFVKALHVQNVGVAETGDAIFRSQPLQELEGALVRSSEPGLVVVEKRLGRDVQLEFPDGLAREVFWTASAAMQLVRAFRFGPEPEKRLFVDTSVRHRVDGFRAAEIE